MTVDGLVNVQCGETIQKYDIDPLHKYMIGQRKNIADNLLPFHNSILTKTPKQKQ